MTVNTGELILRGKKIRVNKDGFVSLNDIHKAAGFSKNKRPFDWQRLPSTNPLIIATYERVTGKSRKSKFRTSDVYKVVSGLGTWAHPILAASYAGYLKPELEVEIKEVWLRYKSADPTLADEVLERASPEDNEWAARRAMGRAVRGAYTAELKARGVAAGKDYAICTNATYQGVFGFTAKALKAQKGLKKSASLRDNMSMSELAYIAASEALSVERMDDEDSRGFGECRRATSKAAGAIRSAIEADRKDRQKRLPG